MNGTCRARTTRCASLARIASALALASGVLLARPALAEYAACSKPPTRGEVDAAHGAYVAGRHSFDEGDYATAITYFTDAYRRDCTKHELLPIIARAYELSQNRVEALVALETFLKRVPANDPGVEPVKKRISNLRSQGEAKRDPAPVVAATTAPAPSNSTTANPNTNSNPSGPAPVPVEPSAGAPAMSRATPHEAAPPADAPASTRKPSILPWLLAGAGVVAAGVGVFTAIQGTNEQSDARAKCPDTTCEPGTEATAVQRDYDEGTRQVTLGGVIIGLGVLAIGGGITWAILDRSASGSASGAAPAVTTSRWIPGVGPSFVGLAHTARF